MRTIKFYGWEEAFRQVADDDQVDKFVPPAHLRIARYATSLVGSSLPQISAALTVSSFLHTSNNIEYADILLVMSSAESLTGLFSMLASATGIIKSISETSEELEMLLRKDDYQFIACRNDADDVAVSMDCCSFQWNTGDFALKNMDLRISKGEFAVVVGRVGSGKSSLLSAICSEMPIADGTGLVSGKIGYVSQKPWIMNATVRDNVLFGSPFDEKFYHTDIKLFPAQDLTEIGFRGINLSGGQKARLALARAIYSRADIFVLDDLLAAVDAHNAGSSVARTRILVTHAEHVVPLADRVVTLVSGCATVAKQVPAQLNAGVIPSANSGQTAVSDDSSAGSGQFTYDPERGVDTHIWPKLWQYIVFCGFSAVGPSVLLHLVSTYIVYRVESPDNSDVGVNLSSDWPTTGTIEFRDYSMRYCESQDLVRQQEKIGVVGRTGAGKSSLTFALMRLVSPDSGAIFIDGVDISSIGLKHLRSKISIIPQDPALFNGTIRENLDPLNEFTDDEGIGLNKWIEDGGRNFSVGQRQLVSLCRALLWKRKILVLDEATANVDTKTDQIMQRVIHEEFKDCTVLTIAHRLRTVMDSDRILVMDQGRVAEFDSPANLLAQDTMFKGLVETATVFVSYLAATANDCAREAGHKTILANDVFKALEAVGLTDFIDKLKEDFEAHTVMAREKKEMKSKQASADGDDDNEDESDMAAATEGAKGRQHGSR
ncbi:P-loop containing nucleoside triphosphate hydrolase protein [Linderina pennispora]|uniref:p-loop containing nucleoside triphosphate hydrolase protein n=1 Tax=Linderina pennispora TaxID=61395 RepID=A0A1Y1WNG8_9FUNG|nr:P-loop containing nucleoside triphosphate hydrolase protein [Linderina pennispora]ORX75012.1 P-loop containing nucleoside triphosphate hydrolase protein [Linderina pennispora]